MRHAARLNALALLFVAMAAAPARAVPVFGKEAGVRLSSASFGAATGAYAVAPGKRVYYVSGSSQILSATTVDGAVFALEAGVRVSSLTVPKLDIAISSITGVSVLALNAGGFRMAYSVFGTTGSYRIYTATSADGTAWANETGTAVNLGNTFVGSPSLINIGTPNWQLYFTEDLVGGGNPNNFFPLMASSTNEGRNFGASSFPFFQSAANITATQRTDGKVRLFFTEPVSNQSSATVILSALSTNNNGTSFNVESGIRGSTTAPSALSAPLVIRSTDATGFRWRMYYTVRDPYVTVDSEAVISAFTELPDPQSINPNFYFTGVAPQQATISGEIFGPTATAALQMSGQAALAGAGTAVPTDQTMTTTFNTQNAALGSWNLAVTNPSGQSTTLNGVVTIDFQGGSAVLTDNLMRPRLGTKTKIQVTIFTAGQVSVKIYTAQGQIIATLANANLGAGQYNFFWDGTTSMGHTVASGVYLVEVKGPKLNAVNKVVVIK